jgi:fatty acid desaturase
MTSQIPPPPQDASHTHTPAPSPSSWVPPEALNLLLSILILGALLSLHWAAAQQTSIWGLLGCAVAFALTGLPLYALMHEAMHHTLHRNERINNAVGFLLSALFPGPFTFLKNCHLGHHRRNRTDAELFDGFYPHDNPTKKRAFFYTMYLGVFWLMVPIAALILLFFPRLMMTQLVQDAPAAAAMVNGIPKKYLLRIRLESFGMIAVQCLIFWGLGLTWASYLTLYAAYGFCWSSQNYITHARSPRDIINGAFNLRVNKIFSLFILHFNWHLAHHQHPAVPWLYLPHLDDPNRQNPKYWWAFVRFWRGPTLCTEPAPKPPGKQGQFEQTQPQPTPQEQP